MKARPGADRDPRRARGTRAGMGGRRWPRSPSGSRSRAAARGSPSPRSRVAVVVGRRAAQPAGARRSRRDPRGRRRRGARPGALLAARARPFARHRRLGRLGRGEGRLEAAASGATAEASWSPFGRFVVAARPNELAALTPDGEVRWTLARPDVRLPRWGGTRTDTRIAYFSGGELRVVGGDGKGDRLLDPEAARARSRLAAGRRTPARVRERATAPSESSTPTRGPWSTATPPATPRSTAPGARSPLPTAAGRSSAGPTRISSSSRGSAGRRQIQAVSNVSAQFRSRSFPRIEGWCCAPIAGREALGVDSGRVLARHRRGDGARGAARGRAGAALLLPVRLVADLNAGAAPPA